MRSTLSFATWGNIILILTFYKFNWSNIRSNSTWTCTKTTNCSFRACQRCDGSGGVSIPKFYTFQLDFPKWQVVTAINGECKSLDGCRKHVVYAKICPIWCFRIMKTSNWTDLRVDNVFSTSVKWFALAVGGGNNLSLRKIQLKCVEFRNGYPSRPFATLSRSKWTIGCIGTCASWIRSYVASIEFVERSNDDFGSGEGGRERIDAFWISNQTKTNRNIDFGIISLSKPAQ